MNEEETDEVILFDQLVVDAEDLVDVASAPDEDDYEPTEEVILLDMTQFEDEDLLEVA